MVDGGLSEPASPAPLRPGGGRTWRGGGAATGADESEKYIFREWGSAARSEGGRYRAHAVVSESSRQCREVSKARNTSHPRLCPPRSPHVAQSPTDPRPRSLGADLASRSDRFSGLDAEPVRPAFCEPTELRVTADLGERLTTAIDNSVYLSAHLLN